MRAQILGELAKYKDRMLPFMPGRRVADKQRAFFVIFSTMIGAIAIARILPDPETRAGSARQHTRFSLAQLLTSSMMRSWEKRLAITYKGARYTSPHSNRY